LGAEHLRKQNDRAPESESHGLTARHITNFRSRTNEILRLLMDEARGSDDPGSAQSPKPPQAEANPAHAKHDTGNDHPSEK
jgi:hypothetical protein